MMRPPRGSVVALAAAALLASAHGVHAHRAEPSLTWTQAFPVVAAAEHVHVDAHFQGSDGKLHRLQMWRNGTSFLHRQTDEALDLYVSRASDSSDYAYRLVDHRRRLAMDVRRNQLYRIGVFSDWFGLAHVLDRPKTAFTVRAIAVLPSERRADCAWRLLVRQDKGVFDESRICWSAAWGLPLAIRTKSPSGSWVERLTVDRVEAIATPAEAPTLPEAPAGYASFDAGSEIDPKAGD